jgi:hypothetical protein
MPRRRAGLKAGAAPSARDDRQIAIRRPSQSFPLLSIQTGVPRAAMSLARSRKRRRRPSADGDAIEPAGVGP